MTRYAECLAWLTSPDIEGGYNHGRAADRGGPTNHGITQRTYDLWRDAHSQPRQPVTGIAGAEVEDIYRVWYWEASCADDMPAPIDLALFDSAVQHGVPMAKVLLQRALGVTADSKIGPVTRAAIEQAKAMGLVGQVASAMIEVRREYYAAIIRADQSQRANQRGWENRLRALKARIDGRA